MSRVVELQDGLVRDPAYALEFARLDEHLAKLKRLAKPRTGRLASGAEPRRRTEGAETKARIA